MILANSYVLSKRIFGGKYSNHQQERIIAESPLIETYKNIRRQFEQMFCLDHKTSRHSPPKMTLTFKKLTEYMRKEKAHEPVKQRKTEHTIMDMMTKGLELIQIRGARGKLPIDSEGTDITDWDELGDEIEEVEDDGSLDI
jgi:hypothetical protein